MSTAKSLPRMPVARPLPVAPPIVRAPAVPPLVQSPKGVAKDKTTFLSIVAIAIAVPFLAVLIITANTLIGFFAERSAASQTDSFTDEQVDRIGKDIENALSDPYLPFKGMPGYTEQAQQAPLNK